MTSMNIPDIADATERRRALDPRQSFIVQAPAGSGKTELLTQRVLVLLATVDEPEEVVAITFTRKAAAEMRHRVFEAVRRARDEPEPGDAHRRETWRLARAALARSHARGWGLDDNPQRLRILTIDSLCAQIVQQAPLASGFGGRVQVLEQAEPAYREAARAVLELIESDSALAAPVARVLAHFDNRAPLLEQQLVELLARRDQWLGYTLAGPRPARETLETALAELMAETLSEVSAQIPEALRRAWLESAAWASSQLYAEHPQLALHGLRDGGWPSAQGEALPHWCALIELVLKRDDDWRQKIDGRCGFPGGKTKAEKAERDPPRAAHFALIAALAEIPGLDERLARVRRLPPASYSDAQWDVLQALLDTLRLAAAQLRLAFAARGEVDFCEVAMQAVSALGQVEAPSELALRLDYRLRHLLVDEFQDTSTLQWRLLERLVAGWQPGDGRTLFVVGDPMQSIYRFRDADVGLFMDARRRGIAGLSLQALQLCCNFRSQAALVDWVNRAFARVLPAVEDRERGAAAHALAVATRAAADGPAVALHAFAAAGAPTEAEARRVLEIVQRVRGARPQASVAVLVRSRGHLEAIAPALRAAGLSYRAVDIEGLAARPVIGDLRSLTRALLHPADRIAWLAVLRAPWCGLTLADLWRLTDGLPTDAPLLPALRDAERRATLSADGQARLAQALAVLDSALAQQGRKPLRRWIEGAWLALGGPAVAGGEHDLADARVFFGCLERLARGPELPDLDALDLALRELKAQPDPAAGEALSLMTIHKSKGLEFDVVIVPGLGRGTRQDHRPLVSWATRRAADGGERLLLAPVHGTGEEREPLFEFIGGLQAEKQRHEDARLVYVAATRARGELHLLGEAPAARKDGPGAPAPRSLLARLWPAVGGEFAAPSTEVMEPPREEARRRPPAIRRLVAGWQAPPLPAGLAAGDAASAGAAIPFDWAGASARAVGIVYHRWVQQIAREGIARWPAARVAALGPWIDEQLAAEGLPAGRRAPAAARVQQALRNTLDDPRGRWILAAHAQARSEWALTVMAADRPRRLVLDRSFVDGEGRRWVVDFKTSVHEGGELERFLTQERERYREQLEAYRAALAALGGQESVRVALYLPLLDVPEWRWIELAES